MYKRSKTSISLLIIVGVAGSCHMRQAHAARFRTLSFEGTITSSAEENGVSVGDPFRGTFSYDIDAADDDPDDPSTGSYFFPLPESVPSRLTYQVGGFSYASQAFLDVLIFNDNEFFGDWFVLSSDFLAGPNPMPQAGGTIFLEDETMAALTSDRLPASLANLEDFGTRDFSGSTGASIFGGFSGEIHSIRVVPEPSAALLLLCAALSWTAARRLLSRRFPVALAGVIAASVPVSGNADSMFLGLGSIPGVPASQVVRSAALKVSADGSTVIGWSAIPNNLERAFRWTLENGVEALEEPANSNFSGTIPTAVSADGSVIVGWGFDNDRPFRWTSEGGMQLLSPLSGHLGASASDVSADGSAVFGTSSGFGFQDSMGVSWREPSAAVPLFDLIEPLFAFVTAVSGDGSVIVGGDAQAGDGSDQRPYRWTETDGWQPLTTSPGNFGVAHEIALDGTAIIGDSGGQAFRWTESTGIVGLGFVENGVGIGSYHSDARGVSEDGSLVVGTSQFFPLEGPFLPAEAFVWDEGHEMRNLIDLLSQEYGLAEELIGWQLTEANGISDDGLVIAGGGINPAGRREAWVAILDRRPDVLVGDYNGNDLVEQADLDLVLGNWGDELLDPAAVGWLNDPPTGTVDQHELDKVLSQWGKTAAALPVSAAVPEPTTSALLFVALALISLPQRRPVLPQ